MCTVQLLRHDTYTAQIILKSGLLAGKQIQAFCYSYDYKYNHYIGQSFVWQAVHFIEKIYTYIQNLGQILRC